MAWSDPSGGGFSSGELLTATKLNTYLRDNMKELWHEVAYTEFVSDVTTSTATEASPADVVSAGAVTYSAYPTIVEFNCIEFDNNGAPGTGGISLWDASTDLGRLSNPSGRRFDGPVNIRRRLTPSAGSHTYKVRLWTASAQTAACRAGAGGTGTALPGYIRVLQRGG